MSCVSYNRSSLLTRVEGWIQYIICFGTRLTSLPLSQNAKAKRYRKRACSSAKKKCVVYRSFLSFHRRGQYIARQTFIVGSRQSNVPLLKQTPDTRALVMADLAQSVAFIDKISLYSRHRSHSDSSDRRPRCHGLRHGSQPPVKAGQRLDFLHLRHQRAGHRTLQS